MLDFTKPMKFEFRLCSMLNLIQSSLDVIEPKIKEKNIVIHKNFPKGLPFVMMDYEKMEQVVINLFLNSIEAIREEGNIKITLGYRNGEAIRIQISDNGEGIAAEDLPFIFDPFFSKKAKGTGLGLTNVKKIIEAHGGSIEATPEIPRGVCMSFTIPCGGSQAKKSGKTVHQTKVNCE